MWCMRRKLASCHCDVVVLAGLTGVMTVVDHDVFDDSESTHRIWSLLNSAEANSSHPIAKALVAAAKNRGAETYTVTDFNTVGGRGLSCTVDGSLVLIGNLDWMMENGVNASLVRLLTDACAQSLSCRVLVCVGLGRVCQDPSLFASLVPCGACGQCGFVSCCPSGVRPLCFVRFLGWNNRACARSVASSPSTSPWPSTLRSSASSVCPTS